MFSGNIYVDSNDRKVKFSAPPERIIVTSPEVQEILYELNCEDKIIANIRQCDYPEKLKKLPKVGDFKNLNIEKIISLKPDLIIVTDYIQRDAISTLSRLKYKVFIVYIKDTDQLCYFIQTFGKIFKKKAKAEKMVNKIKHKLKLFHRSHNMKTVFPLLWSQPLMSAGNGTLINDVIEKAGGINLAKHAGNGYITINQEYLLKNKPDYILLCDKNIEVKHNLNFLFKKYNNIKIIKNIHPDLILRAGPRLIKGIKKLNKILYKK